MKRLYAGRVINFGGKIGYAFEYFEEIRALQGSYEIWASWDITGIPRVKTLNVMAIVDLPSQVEFDEFELLPNIYNLQTILIRGNPAYTEITQQSGQSAKEATIQQLQSVTNAIFTNPEINQLKQEFPLIQTSTETLYNTFYDIIQHDQ